MIVIVDRLTDQALPTRKFHNDAGADIYVPDKHVIAPGEIKTIPLGLVLHIPDTYMGLLMPRSSLVKKGITVHYTPIDSGYRGEVMAMVHNMSNEPFTIEPGDRVCQLVIVPVLLADFDDCIGDARGTGGFGSTGK